MKKLTSLVAVVTVTCLMILFSPLPAALAKMESHGNFHGKYAVTAKPGPNSASCNAMFKKADRNHDGSVGGPEAAAFEAAYVKSGGHMNETTKVISKHQFVAACMKKAFQGM